MLLIYRLTLIFLLIFTGFSGVCMSGPAIPPVQPSSVDRPAVSPAAAAGLFTQKILPRSHAYAKNTHLNMVLESSNKDKYHLLGITDAGNSRPFSHSAGLLEFIQAQPEFSLVHLCFFTRPDSAAQLDNDSKGPNIVFFNILVKLNEKGLQAARKLTVSGQNSFMDIKFAASSFDKGPDSALPVRFSLFSGWGVQPIKSMPLKECSKVKVNYWKSENLGKAAFEFIRNDQVLSYISI